MIAFQGIEGAYSHLACRACFPGKAIRACESFQAAMALVEAGDAELAMIPLENSSAGRIEEIYRLIPKMRLHISGEHFQPIHHCLLGVPGASMDSIETVLSHPQALAQCGEAIDQLALTAVATLDTAGAALEIAERQDATVAAIASELAAEIYGLDILQRHFQDTQHNTTRFIMLAATASPPPLEPEQTYITSLLYTAKNIPAALYKTLGGFATNGVNLVKLESYLSGDNLRSSQFHVDIAGHCEDAPVQRALEELAFFADDIRNLGTYPAHAFRHSRVFHD